MAAPFRESMDRQAFSADIFQCVLVDVAAPAAASAARRRKPVDGHCRWFQMNGPDLNRVPSPAAKSISETCSHVLRVEIASRLRFAGIVSTYGRWSRSPLFILSILMC